jgi:hypothetical protein
VSTSTTTRPSRDLPGFARRNRVTLGLGTAVVLALLLVTWLGRDSGGHGGHLDPENPAPGGARALAQVLADHGVPVDVVRGRRAFADAKVDSGTTVMVSNPEDLGSRTFAEVDERVKATSGSILVIAGVTAVVADGLGVTENDLSTATERERTPADCFPAQPLLDGLTLTVDGNGLGVPGEGCFGNAAGRLLLVDPTAHRWVLLDGTPLSNDQVDRDDNAAVGLRLLGQRDRVVWYVADPDEIAAGEATDVGRLLPPWLVPAAWLLCIAALALLLQRGRRLGPLVVEPVPVTIRALESTTALGRLYEKARDRRHAANLLVEGTAGRLRQLLGAAPSATREELLRAIALRTGRSVEQIRALLPDPVAIEKNVRSDADLVTLAQELTQLEEEVRTV